MVPEKVANIKVSGMPATVMTEMSNFIYSEFISCILEISEKLDLTTYKQNELQQQEEVSGSDEGDPATSDPVSGLKAKVPKDFQVYMNVVSLLEKVLPLQSEDQLEPHIPRLVWFFVTQSSLQPLVSAHYNATTTVLTCSRQTQFFSRKQDPEVETSIHLLMSYVRELLQRCRQYRDQLLASCLTLILHLPLCIVQEIFPQLVSPLQMALQLGVSYLPLAEVCILALQLWTKSLSQEILSEHMPHVLPLLLPYLRSQETGGEAEVHTRVITVKMAFARQRRKVDQKKMKESKRVEETAMQKIQLMILRLIGSLDPLLRLHTIPQDPDTIASAAVRWNVQKLVKFATPFEHIKIDIYLDDLLPHVVDLAVNSSDRQTKVAASELLHSIIILMIGTGAQKSQETQLKEPMAPLYRHIFSAMLRLACDPDHVTRQLFLTLSYQTIHWFTNNRNFENVDTMVLLEALMEGIVTANDPALRDVSAQCLAEFVKWSRKQCRQQNSVSSNIKSIIKRIFSFCKHPSAFKRLGGALAWNSIYREIREDGQAVDIWTLDLLAHLMTSLDLAQVDDPALGTHEQTKSAINHIERIIRVKSDLFQKKSGQRRLPPGFGDGTLVDVLKWLFEQCGRPKALVRHTCMELLASLAPQVKGCASVRDFIEKYVGISKLSEIVDILEGGGEAKMGISYVKNPTASSKHIGSSLKDINIFLEALSASLDGYCWLIGQGIVPAAKLLNHSELQLFSATTYFINEMALLTVSEYMKNHDAFQNAVATPYETEATAKLKCTVIVRLLDFVSVVLQEGPKVASLLSQHSVWSATMFSLLTCCTLDPASVGFDIKDTEVSKHLPSRLEEILGILARRGPSEVIGEYSDYLEKQLQKPENDIIKMLPLSLSETAHINLRSRHVIEGIGILEKSGWLAKCNVVSYSVAKELVDWLCGSIFKEQNLSVSGISPHPSLLKFLYTVMQLAITLDPKVKHHLLSWATNSDTVSGTSGQEVEKGSHVLSILGPKLIPQFLESPDDALSRCVEMIREGRFLPAMGFASALLTCLIRNADIRKKYSVKVVQSFLKHWPTLAAQAGKTSLHQDSVLSLLSSLFLIDREGTIKSHCTSSRSDMVVFYNGLLADAKVELQAKIKVLKLLPFFFTMGEDIAKSVSEALEMLSLNHFPLHSTEFSEGGARDREYHQAICEILTALELSLSPILLQFVVNLFCREDKHRYEEVMHESLEKFMKKLPLLKQQETLKHIYDMYNDPTCIKQNLRYNIMDLVLTPLLQQAEAVPTQNFLLTVISAVMAGMSAPVHGRSDEQHKTLVTKVGSFMILQIMYSKLPREKLFAPGSEINAAFRPGDQSGKELTKEIFRYAAKISKGELRHDQTHAELRRLCACAAYNAIIAVLACVQNDLRFYTNFLFSANPTKGEVIWECLVDCSRNLEFDVEINFKPASKKRFVAVRQKLRETAREEGAVVAGTVQYMASHYLSDSSLREDMSQFDFNNSVVLAMSQTEKSSERVTGANEMGGVLMPVHMDQSDYNGHEVMANLTAVINHMVDAEIMVLHKGDTVPKATDVPQWMTLVQQKLDSADTPRNVKLFLLRVMMNNARIFEPYAAHFVSTILTCLVDGTIGDKINYFFCDVMVMVMGWGSKAVPQDTVMGRNIVGRVLRYLCMNTPQTRADIFKYNLDVVRSVVECWKSLLTVPYTVIYSLMEVKDGAEREVEAGLQLLGIILANGLPPYTVDSETEKKRCESLVIRLLGAHYASVYGAAAEVMGLILKYTSQKDGSVEALEDAVVKRVTELTVKMQGQGLTCIYNIHKHYPSFVKRLINKLLNLLPKLYGIHRKNVLECLIAHSATMEDIYLHLKEQNLLDILAKKEASTQLVALQLVNAVMPRLTPSQLLYFMPGVVAFASHPAPSCRETMYDVLFWVYDNFSNNDTEDGHQLESQARGVLLRAVKEEDAALRQIVLNFWLQGARSMTLTQCLLHILRKMYSPESEDSFLQMAIYVLLEATRHSADYQRNIFDQPLTECKFREMKVSTAWRARHASMIPMFAETQASNDTSLNSLLSYTQGSDTNMETDGPAGVQATQANVFSATQAPGATYNWVTDSTFDTTLADMEYEATHAPTQGSTSGLIFNVGASGQKDRRRFKRPGIGNSRMRPADEPDGNDAADTMQSKLIRRRFVKNQDREKQSIYFAKIEERRSKLREKLEKERKFRREAQVTMYRQYRVGELPDVQIPHRALIGPLQALSQRDEKVARLLFEVLAQGVINSAGTAMHHREEQEWNQELHEALNGILSSSYMCCPQMLRTVLHLMINNDVRTNPESLTAACLGSRLEALGILVLERQALLSKRGEEPHPARKKMRKDAEALSQDDSLWLSIAEMYKNLNMWDVVRGVVQGKLGAIKEETQKALEAEATNNHVKAFLLYRQSLDTTDWEEEPLAAENRLWEEWYSNCAAILGQWSELENFVEKRFLQDDDGEVDLNRVWLLPKPTATALPALVHSKLMNILDGSETDGNLIAFIDQSMGDHRHRSMLEGDLPLQLGVLAAHQEKFEQANVYANTATSMTLLTLSQYSVLTPNPLLDTLQNVQLLTELSDCLNNVKYADRDFYSSKVKQTVTSWKKQKCRIDDNPLMTQCLASYRDLYLHLMEKKLPEDSLDVSNLIKDTKNFTHRFVIRAALHNSNYHLANRHLKKISSLSEDEYSKAQFYFLMAETHILRGQGKQTDRLKYLVEAWAKYLGRGLLFNRWLSDWQLNTLRQLYILLGSANNSTTSVVMKENLLKPCVTR
ncbi:putative DNA-dependent protein kinase catalytic subunit-like [Penaeus vannamei]|uniref:Putative DNA-dependent protein kinase catalytic subunit-like n=1 Tax=Penaeus vannamei TaxID=6689 RepID=A0A3R7M9I8_PENVA|nr:putative DNA-dependent protein kinase catalytic subunit-like [Penaeus vannamei]